MLTEGRDRQSLNLSVGTQSIPSDNVIEHNVLSGNFVPKTQNSLERIGLAALDKSLVFSNLMGHFTMANLMKAYKALDASRAVGIDGITKRCFGENLEANLEDLIRRVQRGSYRPQPKREVLIPKENGKLFSTMW